MLRNLPINHTALTLKRILDGDLMCDTYNLKLCYYDFVIRDKGELEGVLNELKVRGLYNKEYFQEFISEFEAKIDIYNRYLKLLEERQLAELN